MNNSEATGPLLFILLIICLFFVKYCDEFVGDFQVMPPKEEQIDHWAEYLKELEDQPTLMEEMTEEIMEEIEKERKEELLFQIDEMQKEIDRKYKKNKINQKQFYENLQTH